jgi:hypothetical protein
VLPLLLGLAGLPLGAIVGGVGWEWSACPIDSGSLEGPLWVIVFASIGGLVGVLVGIAISARRERRSALP